MRAPRLGKSPNQDFLARLKEQQLDRMAKPFDTLKNTDQVRKKYPLSNIDAQGHISDLTFLLIAKIDKSWQQGGWKVIDTEISGILKHLECVRFTGPGQSTNND
jgi:hypothetical protein